MSWAEIYVTDTVGSERGWLALSELISGPPSLSASEAHQHTGAELGMPLYASEFLAVQPKNGSI